MDKELNVRELALEGPPAIAQAAIASINEIAERISKVSEWKPGKLTPSELALARDHIVNLIDVLAELRSDVDILLRASSIYAFDTKLLSEIRISTAARVARPTIQNWRKKMESE